MPPVDHRPSCPSPLRPHTTTHTIALKQTPTEVVSLLRELAAGLEDEETAEGEGEEDAAESRGAASGQSSVGVQWRQAYLGSEQPPLTLGPLCVKQAAGAWLGWVGWGWVDVSVCRSVCVFLGALAGCCRSIERVGAQHSCMLRTL